MWVSGEECLGGIRLESGSSRQLDTDKHLGHNRYGQ